MERSSALTIWNSAAKQKFSFVPKIQARADKRSCSDSQICQVRCLYFSGMLRWICQSGDATQDVGKVAGTPHRDSQFNAGGRGDSVWLARVRHWLREEALTPNSRKRRSSILAGLSTIPLQSEISVISFFWILCTIPSSLKYCRLQLGSL